MVFEVGLMNKRFRLFFGTAIDVHAPMPTAAAVYAINNAEFSDHPDCHFRALIDRMEDLARMNHAR